MHGTGQLEIIRQSMAKHLQSYIYMQRDMACYESKQIQFVKEETRRNLNKDKLKRTLSDVYMNSFHFFFFFSRTKPIFKSHILQDTLYMSFQAKR